MNATEREALREQIKTTRQNLRTVIEVYQNTREKTPAETVAELVNRLGYDVARETVAELVNTVGSWDGRISSAVRNWAQSVETAATRDEMEARSIYTPSEIHSCHIDQIAEAMREYQPTEQTTEQTTEEPAAEPFPALRQAIEAEAVRRVADRRFYIENGFMPSWAEEYRQKPDCGLEQYSTPAKWEAYQNGSMSREKAVEIAVKRGTREIMKWKETQISKLHTAAAAPDLGFLSVSVECARSRTWGANPTATARTSDGVFTGHASGCGYDKESAAVAEALNKSPAVLRVLYTAAEAALQSGKSYTRFNNGNVCWGDVLGYGSGYAILPYFEGGVGVSCFWSILKGCGYVCQCTGSGKWFDSYTAEKKGT